MHVEILQQKDKGVVLGKGFRHRAEKGLCLKVCGVFVTHSGKSGTRLTAKGSNQALGGNIYVSELEQK